jgi:DNA-directed RNA polymerase specialized sigma24 family protein
MVLLKSDVEAALHRLPPQRRRVITECILCDRTPQEVAAEYGLAVKTVRNYIDRSKADLRDALSAYRSRSRG